MSGVAGRLTRNTVLGVIGEVIARLANTLFFLLLAHRISETEAGSYALGFTFAAILLQCALGGLDQFMLRELAAHPEHSGQIMGQCLLLRLGGAGLAYGGFLVWLLNSSYAAHSAIIYALLGATGLSEGLVVLYQSYLITAQRVEFIVAISAGSGLIKLGAVGLSLVLRGDAVSAAGAVLFTSIAGLAGYMLVARRFLPPIQWSLTLDFWRPHWQAVVPFFAIAVLATFEGTIDTLMLARNFGAQGVGVYNAAAGLLAGLLILPRVLRQVILPVMTRYYVNQRSAIATIMGQLLRVLGSGSILIGVTIIGTADVIMGFFYRRVFVTATPVLQILAASFVFMLLAIPSGRLIAAAGKQRVYVPIQLLSITSTVILNLLLQPKLGALGAAWADCAAALIVFLSGALYARRTIVDWPIGATLLRLGLAALPYAATLLGLRALGVHWLAALVLGWAVYAVSLRLCQVITAADIAWGQSLLAQRQLLPRSK